MCYARHLQSLRTSIVSSDLYCLAPRIANSLNIPLSVETVCVFTAPVFSAFAAWSTFLLTNEVKGVGAGLASAAFMAMVRLGRTRAGRCWNRPLLALQQLHCLLASQHFVPSIRVLSGSRQSSWSLMWSWLAMPAGAVIHFPLRGWELR